ncbi:unnamed protein product [Brachionus calyciflorus]|uniref:Calcineurin-like phosphoesterase domain-containing protein n=1 Tax=Brachionus calyciflorus TaxID=104777 RepID=A0A813Z3T0_9BILA|nr:unnamed protein product [Brachionus calyciflorus]
MIPSFGKQAKTNRESKWNDSFSFVQAADTQFGLIDRYILHKDKITWTKEIYYLKLVIQSINQLSPLPKFLVICGDLVDAYPYENLAQMRTDQIKDLKEILSELNPSIQLVCVCGNHDIGDKPTKETIQLYKKDFGDDYFSFWSNGCKFICLNSQLYFDSSLAANERDEQDKWLDMELKQDEETPWKHLIIFQHIPLFVDDSNEPAHVYFNIEPVQRKNLMDRFLKAGVRKVFCGHYHKNAGGFYENNGQKLECIVTTAIGAQLGDDRHGYRIVNVNENSIEHKYIQVTDQKN